jgi:hypothetical protein
MGDVLLSIYYLDRKGEAMALTDRQAMWPRSPSMNTQPGHRWALEDSSCEVDSEVLGP